MSDADETERELRLELLRLEREVKNLDIRLRDQQITYYPVKVALLAGTLVLVIISCLVIVG